MTAAFLAVAALDQALSADERSLLSLPGKAQHPGTPGLALVRAGRPPVLPEAGLLYYPVVDLHYRVFGDTGVVWGYNIDIHKAKDGQGTVVMSRVASIYSRTGGKWRRVCTHVSAVPPAN